jgi:spore coat polysaccharide biosynthesis predicted glycosyltransferase SpsG
MTSARAPTRTRLFVRPECGPQAGLGHLRRSLAVCDAASGRGLSPHAVLPEDVTALGMARRQSIATFGFDEAPDWEGLAGPGDVIVFDGYGLAPEEYRRARASGASTVAFGDTTSSDLEVDVLVVPSQHEVAAPGAGRILAGPRYAPIEPSVRNHRGAAALNGSLLVTMGGADPHGVSQMLMPLLARQLTFEKVLVLLGPYAGDVDVPEELTDSFEIVRDPEEPAGVFASCAAAISAAGSTIWELLCIGVPTAFVVTADNQRGVARIAREAHAAEDLGDPGSLPGRLTTTLEALGDPEARRRLCANGFGLVDGLGADRLIDLVTGPAP